MSLFKRILLSLFSGLLFFLAWLPVGSAFVIFFAFIPLFFLFEDINKEPNKSSFLKGLLYSYPAMLCWNVSTTWWIWNSTPPGAVVAFLLNALLMSSVFGLWQWFTKHNANRFVSILFFISLWVSFEFLHIHWDLSWTWLNLGNVFSSTTKYIQWYEYTGTFGGTLWILGTNFLLFLWMLFLKKEKKKKYWITFTSIAWIVIPIIISTLIYYHYKIEEKNPIQVIIVQQNTDPWEEQYNMANLQHAERIIEVAFPYLSPNTDLIVCSESSIPHTLYEETLENKSYKPEFDLYNPYAGFMLLDSLLSYYPQLNVIVGLSTKKVYPNKATPTARMRLDSNYEDYFNASACYNVNGFTDIYHKSKLVPGVEKMPFPKVFGFLENLVIDLGGPSGSLGIDTSQRPFPTTIFHDSLLIGVPICYESIYGELFGQFVREGASIMAVITNDAWWGNTPGHRQHFLYAKLRAIETRRTILRAANTGLSGIIDEKGDVLRKTHYNERTAIASYVYPNHALTFYVKHGDYLARGGVIVFSVLFLWTIFQQIFQLSQKIFSKRKKTTA